jgi:predicted ferric reductase
MCSCIAIISVVLFASASLCSVARAQAVSQLSGAIAPVSTAPSPAPGGEPNYTQIVGYTRVATSDTVPILDGGFAFKWRAYVAVSEPAAVKQRTFAAMQAAGPSHLLQLDVTGPVGRYVGLGVAKSEMNGPIITTTVNPATGTGIVSDWFGQGTDDVNPRGQATTVVRSTVAGGQFTVTIQTPADAMDIVPGRQRVIVATGTYDIVRDRPLQHGESAADRDAVVVDFLAGTTGVGDSNHYFVIAAAVVCAVCGLYLLVAAALNFAKIVLSPRASMVASGLTALLFIGLVAFYAAMRYKDHKENVKPYAVERSFGDATVFCFWFVLYPVPKHLNLLRLTGSSYERLVPYHIMVGVLVLVAATCHLIAMVVAVTDWKRELVRSTGESAPLFGLLAWLCLLVLVICALTLRRIAYWLFKLTHILFIPTLVFACLHYHPLIYALIPPLALVVADLFWGTRSNWQASAVVNRAHFHPKSGFTELWVTLSKSAPRPRPAQFVLIGSSAGGFGPDLHPFSVAWFDAGSREALFCAKAMGKRSWTHHLGNTIATTPHESRKIYWVGPYGCLQVPLGKTPTCVLVAGGIGITPLLSILQAVRERRDGGENVSRVVLMWTVREAELIEVMQPLLADCVAASTQDGSPFKLLILLYFTSREPNETVPSDLFNQVEHRRIDVGKDVPVAIQQVSVGPQRIPEATNGDARNGVDMTNAGDDYVDAKSSVKQPRVTIYACAPAALMADVTAYALRTPRVLLHTETFTL